MKILIVTALKLEANPIIDSFSLSRDPDSRIYINDDLSLLVVGVGKKHIQSRLTQYFSASNGFETILLNVGICGGNPKTTTIGNPYLIDRIIDDEFEKSYLPDIPFNHPFETREVTTVEKAIVDGGDQSVQLVDMEGAEIFRVASQWLPPSRIGLLKIVSDYMDCEDWKKLPVEKLIQSQIPNLKKLIKLYIER